MAIIERFIDIVGLIPDPDYRPFGLTETELSNDKILRHPLFAVSVSNATGKPVNIYRAKFVLFKRGTKFSLVITNLMKDMGENTDYVVISPDDDKPIIKTDWPFETDDIGLYIRSQGKYKNKIYFLENPKDMQTLREKLSNKIAYREVTTEAVYI